MEEKKERKGFYSREEVAAILKDFQEKNNQAVAKSAGNGAKMREALVQVSSSLCPACRRRNCKGCPRSVAPFMSAVRKALALPPRNCDRFNTLEDALAGWREVSPDESGPFDNWLFAEAKGDVE